MPPRQRKQPSFTEYISDEATREGIRNGTYFIGLHHIPQRWLNDRSYVRNNEFFPDGMDICIPNQSDRNRAFDEDIVVVEITGWAAKQAQNSDKAIDNLFACESETSFLDDPEGKLNGKRNSSLIGGQLSQICKDYQMVSDLEWAENQQPQGRIVNVIQPKPFHFIGTSLPMTNDQRGPYMKMAPYNAKLPRCMVRIDEIPQKIRADLEKHLLLVKVFRKDWPSTSSLPKARFVKSLGYTGTVEAETSAILALFGVEETPFSDEVMKSITTDISVPGTNNGPRKDLRESEFVCSIDPATARDLDDALSIRKLANGHFLVGVHIADVSEYVPEDSAVDLEARNRGTSIYLCQRVIPMLPPELSEHQCSLNMDGDKLAFSVMWEIDKRGHVVPDTQWIGKSIIRNRCKLSYEQAQRIILDDPSVDDCLSSVDEPSRAKVKSSVIALWKLADQIRTRRFEGGSVKLEQPKISFITIDNDSALAPIDYFVQKQSYANHLVEELMLLANKSVAEKMYAHLPNIALLRSHGKPNDKMMKLYKKFLKSRGIDIALDNQVNFAQSIRESDRHSIAAYISVMLVRSFKRAEYVMGGEEEKKLHHFALNMNLYTHFTSPIRRYADLYVHRLLSKILQFEESQKNKSSSQDSEDSPIDLGALRDTCGHLNARQDRARAVSERSMDLFLCLYLDNIRKVAVEKGEASDSYRSLSASIIKIRKSSIFVYVHDIANCVEIPFRAKRQLWSTMSEAVEGISVRVSWKDILSDLPGASNTEVKALTKDFKGLDLAKDKRSKKSTDESELPMLYLLDPLFVSIIVRNRSPLELDAIIHPPDYHGKPLPVALLDDLRNI
ncbi:hypothetical protein XU18_3070 [Perkinsela sp. CCAP 1560/4]|nr:hypothetical protein XU18_3070 [Perkinsela sp. CCAP 1560/4]|eukprot:KNH06013.1 hypothetical protein XU18_3070 [Perkinsela sp. CCAP 1560/4]